MKPTLSSINTSRNLLQNGNGVSENSRAERAIRTRTRNQKARRPESAALAHHLYPRCLHSQKKKLPAFFSCCKASRTSFLSHTMSLFPLYRLAFSASQTCSWKRLPLTCFRASNHMRQALVSASSKCPQTESSWPNLGQVSTLIKFSVTGRGSWEQEDRSGPAPWNGEPFPGEGRLWNGWGKHPSDCCKLQVRDVPEFGIFFSFWNFLESAFTEV